MSRLTLDQKMIIDKMFNKLSEADKKVVIAARRPGPYRGPSYEEYLELKKKEFLSGEPVEVVE